MTLEQARYKARETFNHANIEDARLEAEVLLMHILKLERAQLYSQLKQELTSIENGEYEQLIQRRLNHEPTAYIIGHREFYGLDFHVDERVLIPRPESELLIELGLDITSRKCQSSGSPYLIADIGTGSGAIAIALASSLPSATIYAIDASATALEVAFINCQRHGVAGRVHLLNGDMLDSLPQSVNLIIANLPYIKDSDMESLPPEIRLFEPMSALSGGKDGLDKVRQLLSQVEDKLLPEGVVLLETGEGQAQEVEVLSRQFFRDVQTKIFPDLSGIERVVSITLHP